jgi:hypothetical protein
MAVFGKLSGMVNLQPEERASFRYLFLLSLITGIGLSFYFVAVNTFLIQKTSVSNLPFAYIISGLGGVLLIRIYQSRQRKAGIIRSYRECLAAFFVVALVVFFAYTRLGTNPGYAVYPAYFGFLFNMPFTIMFALSFSAICARLYNLAQSKRLLALVGTGEIVASITGYLSAPLISQLAGGPNVLLPVAAICILPAFIPISNLYSGNREKLNHLPAARASLKKLNMRFFLNERFYLLIAGVSIFSVAAIYFVDYSYLVTVRFMSSYSGLEIAAIVGFFFSIVKSGELAFSFMSGHILSSKGIKFAILLLPLLLAGCCMLAAAGGAGFRGNPVFILSFLFLAKFAERVIRKAISTPAIKVLYQVTGPDRLRIEATIEGLLNQVATILSGVLLLIISAVLPDEDPVWFLSVFSAICFVIFLLWSLLSLKLYDSYKKKVWSYLTEIRSEGPAKAAVEKPVFKIPGGGLLEQQPLWPGVLNQALDTVERSKAVRDIQPLTFYAASIVNHISAGDNLLLNRKLVSTYYSNDNFFYRLSVIRYFRSLEEKFPLKLFREFWDISDLMLKRELISLYTVHGGETPPGERFYFEELCQHYSNELIYALAAQHDLRDLEDSGLHTSLQEYTGLLISVLFGLLKTLYDKSAIQVIYETITTGDQDIESKLFAVELLDNTLTEPLKSKLIPIFEPAPFDQKIHKLQQFVPVYALEKTEQLRELLMKDFTLVDCQLKELCLSSYYTLTGDQKALKAFYASSIRNLREKAAQLLTNDPHSPLNAGRQLLNELESTYFLSGRQLTCLYNQATHLAGNRKERTAAFFKEQADHPYCISLGNTGGNVVFDTYALALMIDRNYSGA